MERNTMKTKYIELNDMDGAKLAYVMETLERW